MPIKLEVEKLERDAFAPFGDIVETRGRKAYSINAGSADRYHGLATVDASENEGRPVVSIVHARPLALPLRVRTMERHPLGSQAFVPLNDSRFLVIVAAAGDPPDARALRAFISDGRQGINYRRGTWHHPLIALDHETDFLVVDRDGSGDNCEEMHFEHEDITVG